MNKTTIDCADENHVILEKEGFKIHLVPGKVVTPKAFLSKQYPSCSIALDGFCAEGPFEILEKCKFNFDHHSGISRLAARATCGQVQMAINLGLLDNFKQNGQIAGHLWINEIDQDTALAIWLLLNPSHSTAATVNALVNVEEHLDASAGSYPYYPQLKVMESINWIFQPYDQLRTGNELMSMTANKMVSLLEAIMARITQYVIGQGERLSADTSYETIKAGTGWSMIKELGAQARYGIYSNNINCYVSLLGEKNDSWRYTLGKKSSLVAPQFNLPQLYAHLNKLEGIGADSTDRWGGSDAIGGSPRKAGSKLNPEQLFEAMESFLREKALAA